MTFRPSQKLSLKAEAEVGSSGGAYFRTSLYDYEKVRAQARYQALKTLNFAADFMALVNNNPVPGVNYAFRTQQESLSMFWSPGKSPGKFFDLEGSYTRSTVYSNIGYLDPGDLQMRDVALSRRRAHRDGAVQYQAAGQGGLAREPRSPPADRSSSPRAAGPPAIISRW